MSNHEDYITRFSFTEEALKDGSPHLERFPGFFSNGPEHFGPHLLNGETYLNPVFALTLIINTKAGMRLLTGVRQMHDPDTGELNRQGTVASVITTRETQARARYLMNAASEFRVPILRGEIEEEGYHITEFNPRNPVLVADYEPGAQLEGEADDMLFDIFYELIEKTQRTKDWPNNMPPDEIDWLVSQAKVWLGPTLVGVSEVGTYFDRYHQAHPNMPLINDPRGRKEAIQDGGRPIMEAHTFHSIIAVINLEYNWLDEVEQYFTHPNEHYSHFDFARLPGFNTAVIDGRVGGVTPGLFFREFGKMIELMVCARGMCLRAAAAGLARHIIYIKKTLEIEELTATVDEDLGYKDGLYRPPIRLAKPASRTIIDLSKKPFPPHP